jgi:hypothetical protein
MKSTIEVIQTMRDSLAIDAHLLMVNREERKMLVDEFDRLRMFEDKIAKILGGEFVAYVHGRELDKADKDPSMPQDWNEKGER